MDKVQHKSNNAILGAPVGWDQRSLPCDALPVTRTDIEGRPVIVSYWRPSPAELADLNAGASITLWVFGSSMPPVAICVEPA